MADLRSQNVGKGQVGLGISIPKPATVDPDKLTVEQFTVKAIKALVMPGKKGIHTVFSNFNKAFEKYFGKPTGAFTGAPDADGRKAWIPCPELQDLIDRKVIESRPAKLWTDPKTGRTVGGAVLYLYGDEPNRSKVDKTLATILG